MSAARDNLIIEKGATFKKTYLYRDANNIAIDLSSYDGRMQIRETMQSTIVLVELTSSPAAGITIEANAETGRIDIRIGADVTDTLNFVTGVYDLELYDPLDVTEVIRLVEGSVSLNDAVTR